MERNIDMREVSDGKLYDLEDMVRADCAGCAGCSTCCKGMGSSIVLDPLDMHRLVSGTKTDAKTLLATVLELNVVDGVILPNLKMKGSDESCSFLDEEGRCRIHSFRPGICRIFPLGRLYENGSFRYFLQVHECKKESRAKVKVKKWIDTPEAARYDAYISKWHYFLKELCRVIKEGSDEQAAKNASMYVLTIFYLTPFDPDREFYGQFEARLQAACDGFGISNS